MPGHDTTETALLSKTQRKQEALAMQKLGEELTGFKPSLLQQLPLPPKLIAAIAEFNRLPNSHGARRRQLQFIGKLMRACDYGGIVSAIERQKTAPQQASRQDPPSPQAGNIDWCCRILTGGDAEISALLQTHPELERQKLRQFHRHHRRADAARKTAIKSKLENYLAPFIML